MALVAKATPIFEQQVSQYTEQAVIRHKAGDEKRQAFWKMLVSSNPQTPVSKETAIFAIRTLLLELQDFKAHRAEY